MVGEAGSWYGWEGVRVSTRMNVTEVVAMYMDTLIYPSLGGRIPRVIGSSDLLCRVPFADSTCGSLLPTGRLEG